MCGLFGWQLNDESRESFSLEAASAILMMRNELRGRDSWGLLMYHATKMKMLKQVGPIVKAGVIKRIAVNQVLAHTRKATTGDVNQINAHPFDMGRIVGAHNGIISNHTELQTKYKRNFSVDSQQLLAHINDNLPLSEVNGYGVVTYIDKNKPQDIFLGVGDSGDLAVAGIGIPSKTTGIIWSSVWGAIEDALDVAGVPKYYQIKIDKSTLYKVSGCDIFKVGKFELGFSSRVHPASYNGEAYSGYTYGRYTKPPATIGDQKKTVKLLSRKQRKRLSKLMREMLDVSIAMKRGLVASPTMKPTMLLSISPPSHPGYV